MNFYPNVKAKPFAKTTLVDGHNANSPPSNFPRDSSTPQEGGDGKSRDRVSIIDRPGHYFAGTGDGAVPMRTIFHGTENFLYSLYDDEIETLVVESEPESDF